MTATKRFLFDYDFDKGDEDERAAEEAAAAAANAPPPEPEIVVPTFSEEEVNAAREQGFLTGKPVDSETAANNLAGLPNLA